MLFIFNFSNQNHHQLTCLFPCELHVCVERTIRSQISMFSKVVMGSHGAGGKSEDYFPHFKESKKYQLCLPNKAEQAN